MNTQDLVHLVAVVAAGSLSGAAKRLGVSTSTVARRIDALEAVLHLRLVDRTSTGARLTQHGERIAALAAPLLQRAGEIEQAAAGLRAGDQARPVRVSATEAVVADILAPAVAHLWRSTAPFPLHLRSEADVVSIAAHEADLAVRMAKPEGASLIARKLALVRLGAFASTHYLAGRDPAALDLAAERLLVYDDTFGRVPELEWHNRPPLAAAVALRTGSTRALVAATRGGGGVALLPRALVHSDPDLIEVAVGFALPSRTAWLVSHRGTRRDPNVAAVRRWIVAVFKARFD